MISDIFLSRYPKIDLHGFDRDSAGRLGWKVFKEQSIPKGLRVVESKDHNKKDINELSYEEFLRWVN